MKEFLSQQGVEFKEFDVSQDEEARDEMLRKTGKMAVPAIAKGDEVVVGYDQEKIEKLLH